MTSEEYSQNLLVILLPIKILNMDLTNLEKNRIQSSGETKDFLKGGEGSCWN